MLILILKIIGNIKFRRTTCQDVPEPYKQQINILLNKSIFQTCFIMNLLF